MFTLIIIIEQNALYAIDNKGKMKNNKYHAWFLLIVKNGLESRSS